MNKVIIKTSGVVIRDKKLLLVSGNGQPFYWTPGGKLKTRETALAALKREFYEELRVGITSSKHYLDYLSLEEEDGRPRQVHTYLVEFEGKPKCAQEISALAWTSQDDIMSGKITLQMGIKNHLLPKLIEDNLV